MFNIVHCSFSHIINLIVLTTKQYIYRSRCAGIIPSFEVLSIEIETVKKIECNLATEAGKLSYFYRKWSKLYPQMKISEVELQSQNAFIQDYISTM